MPPASKAESVIWAESAPLMLWLMIDEHSLITLWGYLPLGRKRCGCLQLMELQQYIIVIKKKRKKKEGVGENQNMMSGRRWHSDYQIISLSSIFLLCACIHCFSSRLSLLIWAGGGRRASVILNQIQNEVVPGGWASTKTSLMKMNASGNLLSPGLHSGIPRDQWGHRGRGEQGRERRGGRGMTCEVSPYGITVGTCIFFLRSRRCCVSYWATSRNNVLSQWSVCFKKRKGLWGHDERWHVCEQLSVGTAFKCV